jgi:hypothetical protein
MRGIVDIAIDNVASIIIDELLNSIDIYEPCRSMLTLNLNGCFEVTDRGVCDVLASVRGLKHVLLDGCEHISSATVHAAALWHGSRLLFDFAFRFSISFTGHSCIV